MPSIYNVIDSFELQQVSVIYKDGKQIQYDGDLGQVYTYFGVTMVK